MSLISTFECAFCGKAHKDAEYSRMFGNKVCIPCTNADLLHDAENRQSWGGYLNGNRITTWTGETLATVTDQHYSNRGFTGTCIRIRATTVGGRKVYGVASANGMTARMHGIGAKMPEMRTNFQVPIYSGWVLICTVTMTDWVGGKVTIRRAKWDDNVWPDVVRDGKKPEILEALLATEKRLRAEGRSISEAGLVLADENGKIAVNERSTTGYTAANFGRFTL